MGFGEEDKILIVYLEWIKRYEK